MSEAESKTPSLAGIVLIQSLLLAIALLGARWASLDVGIARDSMLFDVFIGLSAGIITYVVLLGVARSSTAAGQSIRQSALVLRSAVSSFGVGALLVVAAAAAIGEEFLFRVFLQGWIANVATLWLGVLVSALAFGLMHATSFIYFALSLSIGLAIGAAYALTGSIVMIVCWHFSYDVLSLLVLVRAPHILGLVSTAQ